MHLALWQNQFRAIGPFLNVWVDILFDTLAVYNTLFGRTFRKQVFRMLTAIGLASVQEGKVPAEV